MRTSSLCIFKAATIAALLVTSSAHATLIGQTLTHACPQCGPPYSQSFLVTNGLGPELSPFGQWALDVEATTVKITWLQSFTAISPLDFTLSGIGGGLTSVTLDGSSTFAPTGVSFTNSAIDFNLDGNRVVRTGEFMLFNIGQPTEVPEPTTVALVGLALLGTAAARRRAA